MRPAQIGVTVNVLGDAVVAVALDSPPNDSHVRFAAVFAVVLKETGTPSGSVVDTLTFPGVADICELPLTTQEIPRVAGTVRPDVALVTFVVMGKLRSAAAVLPDAIAVKTNDGGVEPDAVTFAQPGLGDVK